MIDADYRAQLVSAVIDQTLAKQVRALREQRGWTKAELARRAGVSWRVIHNLEDPGYDHGSFRLPTLVKVAHAFDVVLMANLRGFTEWIRTVSDAPIPVSFAEEVELFAMTEAEEKRSAFPWPNDEEPRHAKNSPALPSSEALGAGE